MDTEITQEVPASLPQRQPTDGEVQAAIELLAQLDAEARSLGRTAAAAQVYWAMGRVYAEDLGDAKSAAVCHQNAFLLDPGYKPNLESARRLFASAGRHDRALELHRREASVIEDPAARAESLRAQAALLESMGRTAEARQVIDEALTLAPDHLALLEAGARAARREGDDAAAARLLLRCADAVSDTTYKAQSLRAAVLLSEQAPVESSDAGALREEALRKLHEADPADPMGFFGRVQMARAAADWEAVLRLCGEKAERTGSAADRALVAAISALRLGGLPEALERAIAPLDDDEEDAALRARMLARRDPAAGSEKYVSLGESLQARAPEEAAAHFLDAAWCAERASDAGRAASLAQRALQLVPWQPAALRVLTRTLPPLGRSVELADLLEQAAPQLQRGAGAECLARAATLLADSAAGRAMALAQRAAEMARGLSGPRQVETWSALAFKSGDFDQLSRALEARADATSDADAADILVEASDFSRAAGDEARSMALLRKARGVDPSSAAARDALLSLASLPETERIELLAEKAQGAAPARAAGLHAERAALLEAEGRDEEAVQACAQALALAGVDLPVLRRLARLQIRRAEHEAALAVLVRIAEMLPDGAPRADAYSRAAEVAEWKAGDLRRALELYRLATQAQPESVSARAQLARLLVWTGSPAEAAAAFEELAGAAQAAAERNEARRVAASLHAHRVGKRERAAALLRALLADVPGDLAATAELVSLLGEDEAARGERAELRARLASRCQDPRVTALLWCKVAEDRIAAGDLDGALDADRRALAIEPRDGIAQERVQQALRAAGRRAELADHLELRCSSADAQTRAALSLQRAQIFTGLGRLEDAAAAYGQALESDPDSLLALKGARRIAETRGDREEAMRLLSREASLAHDAGAMVEAALLAEHLGSRSDGVEHLAAALHSDPGDNQAAGELRGMLGDDAPGALAGIYEKIGHAHEDDNAAAVAWTQAAQIELGELNDAPAAFFASGRALARDPHNAAALVLRADAAEAADRRAEAAEALRKLLEQLPDDARAAAWRPRLGQLYAEIGEPAKALALLAPMIDTLSPALLVRLAPGAQALAAEDAARVYRRLVDAFPAASEPAPTDVQLAQWSSALAAHHLSLGQEDEALQAFRRVLRHDRDNAAALRALSQAGTPDEAIAAQRAWLRLSSDPEPLHALVRLFLSAQRPDAAFCAAAALVGLSLETPEERTLYDAEARKPPPVELPLLADGPALHAAGDQGAVRELLAAAAADLPKALPTDMSGGRGALVKGDNPVRRVVAALARALGMPEPQLFLARGEPGVVAPVAGARPGLLVGAEVPRRFSPRQQRFLYARALAHVRRGTHPLAALSAARLASMTGELIRLAAPHGTDFSQLPRGDSALAEMLARHVGPDARARLSELAARAAAAETDWEALALGIRESAERAGLAICGDPAAALAIVSAETQGGLASQEMSRLVRFAVGDAYLELRAK
jgi:tetratricopeptide (TPR) repeat protein